MNEKMERPSVDMLEREILRRERRQTLIRLALHVCRDLVTVAAVAVLLSGLWLTVLRVNGNSMTPGLQEGEVVVSIHAKGIEKGDMIAFYYSNKVLIKRVIAKAGDWVDIDENGAVSVNGEILDEPYVTERSREPCDILLPYQVPDGMYFVMGDYRNVSVDSRSGAIGPVSQEQIAGKIVVRVWPLFSFGQVK